MEILLILALIASAAFSYFLWGKVTAEKETLRGRLRASEKRYEDLRKDNESKRKYIRKLERYLVETANVDGVTDMLNKLFHPDNDGGETLPLPGKPGKTTN